MFTATKDKLLPTTVTGSWPRPSWYHNNTYGERFSICMTDSAFREQFQDATSVVISDQERAGLDILTNGASTWTRRRPGGPGCISRSTG